MKLKMPPKIKVLEALSAIASNRVKLIGENKAEVISSDNKRKYFVKYKEDKNIVYSNDNGTLLKGYVGYPIIALLMLNGVLPYDHYLASKLKNIPWKKLNRKYKNYQMVFEEITKDWDEKDVERAKNYMKWIIEILKTLDLELIEEKYATLDQFLKFQ